VEGILCVLDKPAKPHMAWDGQSADAFCSPAPWRIYNIGNDNPVELMDFIKEIEKLCEKKAIIKMKAEEKCDVHATWADINETAINFLYKPATSIQTGLKEFIKWFREYYAFAPTEINQVHTIY
jgi:UDP-glucuronate 4-epimerase